MVGLSNDISIMPDLHYPSQGSIIICNYPWQPSWLIPKLRTNTSLISSAKFGFMMFMAIHSLRPNINSLRVQLLVEWVVVLHVKRSFCSLWLNIFFHSSYYSLNFWKFELSFQLAHLMQNGVVLFGFVEFHSSEEISRILNW